ncbi:hypothetical protein [Geotoga petraea]|uniref:DUF4365 domain-containing protein n=1 Tax=Geotoga petraea TaxID=28234 RepID=A0A4Z0VZ34_9BACT|nr:hypothetical protein [Geotoga petraea]TGG86743.1 hypothetical protein E4650_09920 [Geotoga petraea]
MNSSDIEESAIDNLKLFLRNDFLKPNFKTEDKNISWDGEIEVFDKPNKRKSDLLGKIPVQIKGKEVKSFNDSANYSINMFDLNNYLNDGGAIFFLVLLKKSKVYRVFYKSLLPMDINNLKKNKENQKTINIKLNKLDRNKVNDVCWEFLDNKNKQYSFKYKNIDNINFDNQVIKSGIFIIKKDENIFDNILSRDNIYLYSEDPKTKILIPKFLALVKALEIQVGKKEFKTKKNKYIFEVSEVKKKEKITFKLGKHITLEEEKMKITTNKGSLKERIKNIEFLIDLWESEYISIENEKMYLRDKTKNNKKIEKLKKMLNYYKDIEKLFYEFNIHEDIDLDNFTTNDEKVLQALIQGILYKKSIKAENYKTGMNIIKLNKYNLLVIMNIRDGNKVFIENSFNKKNKKIILQDRLSKKEIEINLLFILSHDVLIKAHNIDLELIKNEIKSTKLNQDNINWINLFALELIKAYDLNNKKFSNYLNLAESIINILLDYERKNIIFLINKYQIIYRKGKLSNEEKYNLNKMKKNTDDNQILCAINILLDNKYEAELYYNKMNDYEKNEFSKYPIYNLIH